MKYLRLKIYLLSCCCFVLIFPCNVKSQSHSQIRKCSGKVYAYKSVPLNRVSVTSKITGTTVYSDSLGIFLISCAANDKLIFKCYGFQRKSVDLSKQDDLNVKLVFKGSKSDFKKAVSHEHVEPSLLVYEQNHYARYNTHLADSLIFPKRFLSKMNSKKMDEFFLENDKYSTNNNQMSRFYSTYHSSKKW